jgi:hypothetical protein
LQQKKIEQEFSPTHHALLFGWISQAVIRRIGQNKGEALVRKAVQRYGEQRGKRMALRAQADGYPLTMSHYRAYGEWVAAEGESDHQVVETVPQLKTHVFRCPWQRAWEENDLVPFGRLYCLEIDEALVRGFNPGLRLDVNRTLTNDGEPCEFVYHGASLNTTQNLAVDRSRTVMPWAYHLGHLFKTMDEVVIQELGAAGQEVMEAALEEFAKRFGHEAAQIVTAYQNTDFNRLPG